MTDPVDFSASAARASFRLKALVVEDDASICDIYRRMLEQVGFEVHTCGNGAQAVEVFAAQRYSLLIVDYLLPGMDGLRFIEKASAIRRVPTLVASAVLTDRVTIQRLRGLGVRWVLAKPFRLPELRKAFDEAVRAALELGA